MKLSPSASDHALYTHRVPTFMELHHAEFTPQFGESNKVSMSDGISWDYLQTGCWIPRNPYEMRGDQRDFTHNSGPS
ncbi:hypothetical protein [uncultured Tateyamaria sp.]|uniref:hypothetical protein n=1 Tax=uncultured Tateyamaria sp. TaxID=455651 RepID=UPI0026194B84|nr:hypothetical protein [uncultured Tateyamaria sp.]